MGSGDIDEHQAFVLVLDAEPMAQTVLEHAEFSVRGMPQRVGANDHGRRRPRPAAQTLRRFHQPSPGYHRAGHAGVSRQRGGEAHLGQGNRDGQRNRDRAGPGNQLQGAPGVRSAVQMRARESAGRVHSGDADDAFVFGSDSGRATPSASRSSAPTERGAPRSYPTARSSRRSATVDFSRPVRGVRAIYGRDSRRTHRRHRPPTVQRLAFSAGGQAPTSFRRWRNSRPASESSRRRTRCCRSPCAISSRCSTALELKASGMPSPTGAPLSDFLGRIDARVFGLATPRARRPCSHG